ncbi:hypothetical protein LJ655_01990 [Paraburkholderia sp. MMS20-SJTN17]|uniref:Uncharacterized protein n=1 Tax=Paraburkholderia translucens TaxID=2886945 RepID=A0ABS8K7F0_9BURK|nr:hypothetical protein [Paraburkholderia sp. MMS20-SJTN17]MCC8400675.1 hypothetical protein [Paraburkholderia sp. MMS20-SJTN17]
MRFFQGFEAEADHLCCAIAAGAGTETKAQQQRTHGATMPLKHRHDS